MDYQTLDYQLLTQPTQVVRIPKDAKREADRLLVAAHPIQLEWMPSVDDPFLGNPF